MLMCDDPLNVGCHWMGDPEELVSATEDILDVEFTHCPNCNGDSFTQEDDEDDEN